MVYMYPATISASVADPITFLIILHTMWIGPLVLVSTRDLSFLGLTPKKKCPQALLLALGRTSKERHCVRVRKYRLPRM